MVPRFRASSHRSALPLLAGVLIGLFCAPALAKRHGYTTPEGRTIYSPEEKFGQLVDYRRRFVVVEAVVGMAPQGNLAMLIGIINVPVRGVELYGGYGLEANPAWTVSGDLRYVFNIDGYRPFIGAGYSYRELYALDAYSHNVFAEVGYKWVLKPTYHLTVAVGLRRAVGIEVRSSSELRGSDTDPALLARALDDARAIWPTIGLKFSRAF